jgi:hypothetical protein
MKKENLSLKPKFNHNFYITIQKRIKNEVLRPKWLILPHVALEEVIQKLTGPTQVVDLKEAIPQYIIVSGFTPTGDLARLVRAEVTKVIQVSMHTTDCVTFDEDDDDPMTMDVPFPLVWFGSEAFRSVVCSSTLLTTS